MKRRFIPFSASWRMPIDISVSRGVACGDLLFTCGQCDLDAEGRPQRPGDLSAQTRVALDHVLDVLQQAGRQARDLAHLHVFYRSDGSIDERAYGAEVAAGLPSDARPTTVLTPVPAFFYPGVEVEIDAIAGAVRNGLLFVQGSTATPDSDVANDAEAALKSLTNDLESLGVGLDDVCKLTVYISAEATEPERAAAREALLAALPQPGPALTHVVLPNLAGGRVKIEGLAADGGATPVSKIIGKEELRAVRRGDLLFIGGLLALDHKARVMRPHDLSGQTHLVMDSLGQHLAAFGADYEDLVKVNTYYRSPGGAEALHDNLSIRSSYYARPGPASTGMPVPVMDPPGVMISVDAVAVI